MRAVVAQAQTTQEAAAIVNEFDFRCDIKVLWVNVSNTQVTVVYEPCEVAAVTSDRPVKLKAARQPKATIKGLNEFYGKYGYSFYRDDKYIIVDFDNRCLVALVGVTVKHVVEAMSQGRYIQHAADADKSCMIDLEGASKFYPIRALSNGLSAYHEVRTGAWLASYLWLDGEVFSFFNLDDINSVQYLSAAPDVIAPACDLVPPSCYIVNPLDFEDELVSADLLPA